MAAKKPALDAKVDEFVSGMHKAQAAEPKAGKPADVVLVPFAYAAAKDGEVVQLVKGDVITDRFKPESIEHLRSLGFIGPKH